MYNSERKLTDSNAHKVDKPTYLNKLAELEELSNNSQDRIVQIKLAGFKKAGELFEPI